MPKVWKKKANEAPTQGQAEAQRRANTHDTIWMYPNQPHVLIDPATGAHYYNAAPQPEEQFTMQFTLGPPAQIAPVPTAPTTLAAPAGSFISTSSTALPTRTPEYQPAAFTPHVPDPSFAALRDRAMDLMVNRYLLEFKDASHVGKVMIQRMVESNVEDDKERFEALVRIGITDGQWLAYAEEKMWGFTME